MLVATVVIITSHCSGFSTADVQTTTVIAYSLWDFKYLLISFLFLSTMHYSNSVVGNFFQMFLGTLRKSKYAL